MSERQRLALATIARDAAARGVWESFHHGAAVGADTEAAAIVQLEFKGFERRGLQVVEHPAGGDPLARNREIVAAVGLLIAAPDTAVEYLRSGTWATVRYARKAGKPIVILER